jgi:excisionase family DNA binding protein
MKGVNRAVCTVLLRPQEAADALGISRSKLYELLRAGEVESVCIARSRRVPVDALNDYVARLRMAAREVAA